MLGSAVSHKCPPVPASPAFSFQGEFFSLAHRGAVPFQPPALALPPDHDRMVYFGASSYFFNTAGFAYHAAGALVFEITDSMVRRAGGMGLSGFKGSSASPLCFPAELHAGTVQGLRCARCTHNMYT